MTESLPKPARARIAPAGLVFLAVTSIGWGFNWPATKFLLSQLPPLTLRGSTGVVGAALGSYAYYGGGPYYYDDDYYDAGYGPDTYYDAGVEVGVPAGGDAVAYCESRFRSYDPASGTYLGYDGLRHPCP